MITIITGAIGFLVGLITFPIVYMGLCFLFSFREYMADRYGDDEQRITKPENVIKVPKAKE